MTAVFGRSVELNNICPSCCWVCHAEIHFLHYKNHWLGVLRCSGNLLLLRTLYVRGVSPPQTPWTTVRRTLNVRHSTVRTLRLESTNNFPVGYERPLIRHISSGSSLLETHPLYSSPILTLVRIVRQILFTLTRIFSHNLVESWLEIEESSSQLRLQ